MDSDLSDIGKEELTSLLEHVCFAGEIGLHRCEYKGCKTFFILPVHLTYSIYRDGKIVPNEGYACCEWCGENYCVKHIRECGSKDQESLQYLCNECAKTH